MQTQSCMHVQMQTCTQVYMHAHDRTPVSMPSSLSNTEHASRSSLAVTLSTQFFFSGRDIPISITILWCGVMPGQNGRGCGLRLRGWRVVKNVVHAYMQRCMPLENRSRTGEKTVFCSGPRILCYRACAASIDTILEN